MRSRQQKALRLSRCIIAAALIFGAGAAAAESPLSIARQGWIFAGGKIDESQAGHPMVGQLYAEYQVPANQTHPYPVVMIHGGGQNGSNFTGTPDGREGWAQYFLRRGYMVYVVDQVGRGRSAYDAATYGPLRPPDLDFAEQRFTEPERFNLWPQAHLHTQFPGTGAPGDPSFDAFYASQEPSIADFAEQQALMRDAGAALLDRIGPAILLVHSQSGAFAWPIAQARPKLVRAILAVEPSGPPVHDITNKGAPDWFEDSPRLKISGLADIPLQYEPPLASGEQLNFVRADQPKAPDLVRCWMQKEPARKLAALDQIPMLVITSEASYHAPYDDCTVAYLRQAGVTVQQIHLADVDIHGDAHMMMIEKNNAAIAGVMADWLDKQPAAEMATAH